jgi:N-acetylglucosaminyl-diphospho-decaprenol L-rhamnosyltransferase
MSGVSALIVGFHTYDELDRCLASLSEHERGVPVVVVDHDAQRAAGARLVERHRHIVYEPVTENPGYGAGINRAARLTTGNHLLVLNPDVILTAPVSRMLVEYLDAHPTVGIVGGLIREESGAVQPSARRFPDLTTALAGRTAWLTRVAPRNVLSRRNLQTAAAHEPQRVDWVTGAFMLIRRDTFEAIGGFDERFFMYWEDADFCQRAAAAGWTTMYNPCVSVVHLTGRASRHTPVRALASFHRSVFRYYWKHSGWVARLLSPAVGVGLACRFLMRLPRAMRHR